MKIWPNLQQGSEAWFRIRKGRVTASNASRLLTATGKDSSQWEAYAIELCAECIRPDELPSFSGNAHTDRGNELEPLAREAFTRETGLAVVTVGFVSGLGGVVGCSPDALVLRPGLTPETWQDHAQFDGDGAVINGKDLFVAGLECKAPLAKNHATYLLNGGVPDTYRPQVHFSMSPAVTGLPWWFASFCPKMALHLHHEEPGAFTAKMQDAIERFVTYYGALRAKVMPRLLGTADGKEAA